MTVSTRSPGSPHRLRQLMTMPEIAGLAGVHRPLVPTWRRRHPDFPAPVEGDAARPLFDAHQVSEWLIRTGRADAEQVMAELSLHTLASLAAVLPAGKLTAAVTALICLRYLDDDEPLADGTDDILARLRTRAARLDPGDAYFAAEIDRPPGEREVLAADRDDTIHDARGKAGA